MKRIIKISLILLLVGMAVIALFLRKKAQRESMRMNLRTYRRV